MALSAQNASNIAAFDADQRNLPSFRSPPHNFEAEKALLGAILANNNAFDRITDFLKAEHFADPVHGRIYEALTRLIQRNQIADPVTLRMFFEQDGTLADVGGARYLGELAASMVSIINVGDYGRLIYDLFIKRQLIDLGEQGRIVDFLGLRALVRILEQHHQSHHQKEDDDPEGEIAQIGVHRSSLSAARRGPVALCRKASLHEGCPARGLGPAYAI